jgi:hypothetical protein
MKKWRGRILLAEKKLVAMGLGFSEEDADAWYRKYLKHQNHALDRGLVSNLTFHQYMTKVRNAGLDSLEQIGTGNEQFQLGRIGDVGDYENDNCRFITARQNRIEAHDNGRCVEANRKNSEQRKGQTKYTSETYKKISEALKGRTAETHTYIASNAVMSSRALKGRTKENDPRMIGISEKLARSFFIVGPDGATYQGKNLKDHCKKFELNFGHMAAVLRGVERHHKGWVGKYMNLATLETIPPMPKKLEWSGE